MVLGYDGTDFYGSQVQPGLRTVQGELDRLLARLAPGSSQTVLAGRTDRGVHAVGQVVSCDVTWATSDTKLRDALNEIAPSDITVSLVEAMPATFHARYDARWREYRYRIVVAESPPPLERRFVWWRRTELNDIAAQAAAERLRGIHVFGTFAGLGKSRTLTSFELTRNVLQCDWIVRGEEREFRVVANGFLPKMVRNMVAAVVQVAHGNQPVEWIDELLQANDRRTLRDAAPPQGLVLWRVGYD